MIILDRPMFPELLNKLCQHYGLDRCFRISNLHQITPGSTMTEKLWILPIKLLDFSN
jgi:hypothetical protein